MSPPSNSSVYQVQLLSGVKNLQITSGSASCSCAYSGGNCSRNAFVNNSMIFFLLFPNTLFLPCCCHVRCTHHTHTCPLRHRCTACSIAAIYAATSLWSDDGA